MKAGDAVKYAKWLFYVLMVVTVVILGLFFFVGYDNTTMVAAGPVTDPENLDALMYWMYFLTGMGIVCVLFSTGKQFISMLRTDFKGAIKGAIYLILLVALFGVSYAMASEEAVVVNGLAFEDTTILKFTDLCIYPQYVLLLVTTVCTVVALTGVIKAANKIKA